MSCRGDCCVAFPVSSTPDDILSFTYPSGNALEAFTILGMIEPISFNEAVERRERFEVKLMPYSGEQYYKCRHWDEMTRLCGKYSERPWMCRNYPDRVDGCEHGCDCVDTLPKAK